MSSWSTWAKKALDKMDDPNWKIRDKDKGGEASARAALRQVADLGYEPYYTLKAFVVLNNLE